ncbi:MAG: YlbF family regulator [Gemmatimonadales bacterium]
MIDDKAQELGRLIGQAPEYQALRRAEQALRDDGEAQKRLETISRLTREFDQMMAQGQPPDEAKAKEYETTLHEFELSPIGQGYLVARANLDKLMAKVNQLIAEGMERGAVSGIITL